MSDINSPLLANLPAPALARLRDAAQTLRVAAGDVMLTEGELREDLFLIVRGEALVIGRDGHGEPRALARLGPGECFGELSMLSGEPAGATVEAVTESDIWVLPHNEVAIISEEYPALGRNISALLAQRLRLANERHLRLAHGEIVAVLATEVSSWPTVLAYQLARSMAEHAREPVAFLNLTGQADALLPEAVSLREALDRADAPEFNVPGADRRLWLISSAQGDDALAAGRISSTLDRLKQCFSFVVAVASAEAPHTLPVSQHAEKRLLLAHEEALAATSSIASPATPGEGTSGVAVLSERLDELPVRSYRAMQSAAGDGAVVRAVIPGGRRAFDQLRLNAASNRAIDRLARKAIDRSVGLALGGGGAKGYAHIGVVNALQRAGVPIDCVSGCSIGAPIAAGVAAGWELDVIRANLDRISAKAVRPNVPVVSVLTSRSVRHELQTLIGRTLFEDLPTPLGIVAVDIETGNEVLLQTGPVWPAMLASMAYPGIYEPVRLGTRLFVDGGVLNPVPVSAAVDLGADIVLSSNLSSANGRGGVEQQASKPGRRLILESIARSLEIMQSKIVAESCHRADIAIEPRFDRPPGLLDFKRGRMLEHAGEAAVEEVLPKLRSLLPWLS